MVKRRIASLYRSCTHRTYRGFLLSEPESCWRLWWLPPWSGSSCFWGWRCLAPGSGALLDVQLQFPRSVPSNDSCSKQTLDFHERRSVGTTKMREFSPLLFSLSSVFFLLLSFLLLSLFSPIRSRGLLIFSCPILSSLSSLVCSPPSSLCHCLASNSICEFISLKHLSQTTRFGKRVTPSPRVVSTHANTQTNISSQKSGKHKRLMLKTPWMVVYEPFLSVFWPFLTSQFHVSHQMISKNLEKLSLVSVWYTKTVPTFLQV